MSAHALLLWMSARRTGSWQQFRSAVESIHLPAFAEVPAEGGDGNSGGLPVYHQLRLGFERLGHTEFFARGCEDGWRIAPPVLAVSESTQEWSGILCGARSPQLLAALEAATDGSVTLLTDACNGQPPIIRAVGTPDALARFAVDCGVAVQANAPLAILSCLPAVNDTLQLQPAVLPMGADWRIDRFDPQTLGWRACTRDEAAASRNGFFRFVFGYERHHFLAVRGRLWRVPGQIGKYLVLRRRRRNVLHYAPKAGELTMPASCRPPLLIDRALTLCTGSLAVFEPEGALLRYQGIPADVARLAALLLCQEI